MAGRADYRRGNFSLDEIQGKKLYFLLDLEMGGEIIRLSSENILANAGIDDESGETTYEQYYGGLEFDEQVEDPLAFLEEEPDQKSISVTLHLWPQWDISKFIARGVILGAASAALYLWPEGSDFRMRIVQGRFRDPTWNNREEPIVGSIEEDPVQDTALWPSSENRATSGEARADAATFPNVSEKAEGEYYPTIFGSPGSREDEIMGSPGLFVDTVLNKLLIAGHRCISLGDQVTIYDRTDDQRSSFAIQEDTDDLGHVYSFVVLVAAGSFVVDETHEYWVSWEFLTTAYVKRYGLYADDRTKPSGMRGAGDILIYWLRQSNIEWDEGRLNVIRPILNQYKIDTYAMSSADQRLSPYDWILDNLLPLLPISPRVGPGGLHYVLWNYTADRTESVLDLVNTENTESVTEVETSTIDDIVNTFVINYDRDAKTDDYNKSLTITGNPEAYKRTNTIITPNLYGRRSLSTYGFERIKEEKIDIVSDSSTTGLIAAWKIKKNAVQWYSLNYIINQEDGVKLTVGDVITLRDDSRGLYSIVDGETVGRVAMIESLTISSMGYWNILIRMPAADFGTAA